MQARGRAVIGGRHRHHSRTRALVVYADQVDKIGNAMWFFDERSDEVKHEKAFARRLIGLASEVAQATAQCCLSIQAALKGEGPGG